MLRKENTLESLLSAKDAAQRLRVSRSLIYRLIRTGRLTGFRVGSTYRIRLPDLEKYIQSNIVSEILSGGGGL